MFAASGSLVSRTEDAQQVMMLLLIPLMRGYLVSTTSLTNPDNVVIRVLSFATLGLVTVLAARLAGRLYHVSLLQAGSRISWRRALRIMREA